MNKLGFGFEKGNIGLFIGGAVFSLVAANFLKSKSCKKLCVQTLAKGLGLKDDVEHRIATIKEEAEDLYNEAKLSEPEHQCCCESKVEA